MQASLKIFSFASRMKMVKKIFLAENIFNREAAQFGRVIKGKEGGGTTHPNPVGRTEKLCVCATSMGTW